MKIVLFLIILLSSAQSAAGQSKYERESRINRSETPQAMQELINRMQLGSKIKYYKESQLNGHSYEVKTKINDHLYSIEFDSDGNIEDIEQTIHFKEISQESQTTICTILYQELRKFKIEKIQEQWTGNADILVLSINNRKASPQVVLAYELVVAGIRNNHLAKYELLISPTGELLSLREIIERSYQNIEF